MTTQQWPDATPSPSPVSKGLTDEQIDALSGDLLSVTHLANDDYEVEGDRAFARAIEREVLAFRPAALPIQGQEPTDAPREKLLEGLLREAYEMADNWPGIAYSYDLCQRIDAALSSSNTTKEPR